MATRIDKEISIVVPVLNEAALIGPFLRHLRSRAAGAEIIVVDGGSRDNTPEIARRLCDKIIVTQANRAVQMNAGARIAKGEILWFLHADAEVPVRSLEEIQRALIDRRVAGGFFRIALPRSNPIYRLTDCVAHYAGLLLRMRCGDHGIFCRRELFVRADGFPEVPLMEDVEFFRAISRYGRMSTIPLRIKASPRRYQEVGALRLTIAFGLLATLYLFGAPLSRLARIYTQLCCPPQSSSRNPTHANTDDSTLHSEAFTTLVG